MISPSRFAFSHASFWQSSFPALENYVRLVNSGAYERQFDDLVWNVAPERSALISEVAFCLADPATDGDLDLGRRKADKRLSGLPGVEVQQEALDLDETKAANNLAYRLGVILKAVAGRNGRLQFSPNFPGYGAISEAFGDVRTHKVLFEVKSVDRGFRGTDFRQLMIYSLLNSFSDHPPIEAVSLVNPRRGIYHFASLSDMIFDASGCSFADIQLRFSAAVGMGGTSR